MNKLPPGGDARRPFFARKETIPWSGVREFNGEDVALEPTTASCVKWRFGDKTVGFGSPKTANRDGFAAFFNA